MKYLNFKGLFYRALLLTAVVCCCSLYSNAQAPAGAKPATKPATPAAAAPVKGAATIIDAFFKKYKEDGAGPAIDYLFATNKYFTNSAGIEQLKAKIDSLRQAIGNYAGKELIVQKSASPSLVLYSYLVKHEMQPLRFTFIFYKAQNEWVLYRFKYDDQMDVELEEGGKINNKHQ
jgi:hypothetical protein